VPLAELSGELERVVAQRSAKVMSWQLFSTTLIVLVVAATASLATNRVSEILFLALGAYLLVRGVMSSMVSNILAPGSGPFGFVARRFVEWMNFPTIDSAAQLLAPKDGEAVLDIGAAEGRGLRAILYLCNPGKLYATETSVGALQALRANPAFATVETHDADARSLSFLPKHSIDKASACTPTQPYPIAVPRPFPRTQAYLPAITASPQPQQSTEPPLPPVHFSSEDTPFAHAQPSSRFSRRYLVIWTCSHLILPSAARPFADSRGQRHLFLGAPRRLFGRGAASPACHTRLFVFPTVPSRGLGALQTPRLPRLPCRRLLPESELRADGGSPPSPFSDFLLPPPPLP
jgi:hypothetical protein